MTEAALQHKRSQGGFGIVEALPIICEREGIVPIWMKDARKLYPVFHFISKQSFVPHF
jgi:hypothetical protein